MTGHNYSACVCACVCVVVSGLCFVLSAISLCVHCCVFSYHCATFLCGWVDPDKGLIRRALSAWLDRTTQTETPLRWEAEEEGVSVSPAVLSLSQMQLV